MQKKKRHFYKYLQKHTYTLLQKMDKLLRNIINKKIDTKEEDLSGKFIN